MDRVCLQAMVDAAQARIGEYRQRQLDLDMTRGKPGAEQLSLSHAMLTVVDAQEAVRYAGMDVRNYGGLQGLPEMQDFFREMVGAVQGSAVFVGGNSSLNLMHDAVSVYLRFGVNDKRPAWANQQAKFICPVPGYDRHFAICEHFGIEMIAVEMHDDGPDMDAVEALVKSDNSIKGMWCVPKFSNPTGAVYSEAVVKRLASMETAAQGFRLFWDNAYAVHHLGEDVPLPDILAACAASGNPDRALVFASTSKVTFAGAGVSAIISSPANIDWLTKNFAFQTIGYDKINQLRHLRFFAQKPLAQLMQEHAALLRPRFDAVLGALDAGLAGSGLATWSTPRGGYFISLDVLPGCAKEVVALCAELGVKLTPAGASFPHGADSQDSNIRIAPSMPSVADVKQAAEVLTGVVQYVCGKVKLQEM